MGRGSIQIGRGSNKGEEELYIGWAGAYYAQRSLIQPISRHPEFHVTDSLLNSVMLVFSRGHVTPPCHVGQSVGPVTFLNFGFCTTAPAQPSATG